MNRIFYCCFFSLAVFLSRIKLEKKDYFMIFSFITFLLVLFTGLRQPSLDYAVYVDAYDGIAYSYMENSFKYIRNILHSLNLSYIALFVVYAFLSIPLRFYALYKLSDYRNLELAYVVYLSNVYLLQDFTQIRLAVATSLLLFSIMFVRQRKIIKFFICILLAIFFHRTAIIFIPVYFLKTKKINIKLWGIGFLFIYFICGIMHFSILKIIEKLTLGVYSDFITNYRRIAEAAPSDSAWNYINIFNIGYLVRIFLLYLGIFFNKKITEKEEYFPLYLKIYCVGLMFYSLFSDMPVMATRLSEIVYFIDILYFPWFSFVIKERWGGRILIVSIALFMLLINIYSKGLI